MQEQEPIENCKNCNSELHGEYCAACGQPKNLKRINGHYIVSEVSSILNFDKGILFTVRELLLRPGQSIQKFILEDRNRLVKPIVFIILCSLAYTLAQHLLHFEDGYVNYSFDQESTATGIFQWISQHYGYSNILMAVFIALWIKVFFRKYDYNFFEVLILLCFVMGMGMLLFATAGIVDSMVDIKIIDKGFFIGILYMAWAIGQFFGKKIWNYIKAFFAYMLGLITFSIVVMLIGSLIDLLWK